MKTYLYEKRPPHLAAGLLLLRLSPVGLPGRSRPRRDSSKEPVLSEKLVISLTAGLCGALAGNPSEVALVRLMADGPLEPCVACNCPRLYRGTFDALYKICAQEGVRALWRGGTLTMGRSVLVSISQVWSYTQVRLTYKRFTKSYVLTNDIGAV
ncbi:mitochondrial 2-oxoglutarate/malate carrier protein-like [Pararge aegeria]|uniref:mitochondrial 2-oxoglutarate/malate carrier protein-like n=1 Tax=Pararge aegeria TaxID=116150 RepID=UPI0019D223A3|nr:mitochondrial 2-oxoglutarate/malate carrier protein-like [Pararge aegeria]